MTTPRERVAELAGNWRSGYYTKQDRIDLALAAYRMALDDAEKAIMASGRNYRGDFRDIVRALREGLE